MTRYSASRKILLAMLITMMICFFEEFATAQQYETLDGNWIKKRIDAFNRVYVIKNSEQNDLLLCSSLLFYVSGIFAVHRDNNMLAIMLYGAAEEKTGEIHMGKKIS